MPRWWVTFVGVVAVAAAAGCSDEQTAPDAVAPAPTAVAGLQPEGFTTIQARITDANGEVCEVCLWLADESAERSRGLMGVAELGDPVGMVFVADEPTTGSFYMFQTPTPLSIAWFGSDGRHVGSADMEPCLSARSSECPLYAPDEPYLLSIEVFDGGLEPLGLGPGSSVELIEGSEAAECPPDEPLSHTP
jgi:uncharacterized membrane protein (UPF0127 family)